MTAISIPQSGQNGQIAPTYTEALRLDALEFILAHAIRRPAVFAVARQHLTPQCFLPVVEVPQQLLWEAACALYDEYQQLPPPELLATKALQLMSGMPIADPDAENQIVNLQVWMWEAFPGDDSFHDQGAIELLRQFLVERAINDQLKAIWRDSYGRVPTNLRELMAQYDARISEIETLGGLRSAYEWYDDVTLDAMALDIDYIVDRVVARGMPLIVGGKSKTLKTSLLCDLAVSLTAETPFLGQFAVRAPRRVALMSGESGLPVIRETLQRVRAARGVQPTGLLRVSPTLPSLGDPSSLARIERDLRDRSDEVLILDPMYLMMPADDAGNIQAQGERLRRIGDMCQRLGVTLIMAHHLTKSAGGKGELSPPDLADLAWSGYAEYAAQWMLLGRREPYVDGSGQHRLWLRYGGRAGHEGLLGLDVDERDQNTLSLDTSHMRRVWRVRTHSAAEVRATQDASRAEERQARATQRRADQLRLDEQAVLAALLQRGDATVRSLSDATGVSRERVARVATDLLARGIISPTQVRTGGGMKDGFRLVDQPVRGV